MVMDWKHRKIASRDMLEFIKEIIMWYVWFGKKILPFLKYGGVILLGLVVVLSFAQNLPIPGNFQSLVVMSGSMEPKIHTGAVAIIKPSEEVKVGDIITFRDSRDPKNLITHRISEIGENEIIKTKGDANNTPDNWEITKDNIVGKFLFSVPFLGYAVNFAKQPQGFLLLILFPALLIIINEIGSIKKEFEKKQEKKKGNTVNVAAAAIGFAFLTLAVSSGRTLALFSDTETSSGNTISVGVWASAEDVVINELMWSGSVGDTSDEWVELRNMTNGEIDLSGWQLTKWVSGDHEELMLTIPDGKKIPAHGYFLISNFDEAASKISSTPDLVDSDVVLVNDNLQIKLYDGTWDGGATLIDTADDGAGTPAAGDNGNKFSMERNDTPGDGTQAISWHTCLDASSTGLYWDGGATEQGTPGALNLSENDPSLEQQEPEFSESAQPVTESVIPESSESAKPKENDE